MKIILGDCASVLKDFPSSSFDSLVTDPPAGISFMGKGWDGDKGGRDAWITWMQGIMAECLRVLKPGAHGVIWALPRTSHWTAFAAEKAGFEIRDIITHHFGTGFPKSHNVEKATGKREWKGFGTALKPASEHWILVRRPIGEKTVAANVLKHGTGGINIDASRIGTDKMGGYSVTPGGMLQPSTQREQGYRPDWNREDRPFVANEAIGRYPANLVFSHHEDCDTACVEGCAVAELDRQSGVRPGDHPNRKPRSNKSNSDKPHIFTFTKPFETTGCTDSGGASRFFYCAKASKKDRGEDNNHPTVKSSKLMEYLITLVTPPGGRVLDPFMGSGSTGVAALAKGFDFVGIERDKEYFEIAEKRI